MIPPGIEPVIEELMAVLDTEAELLEVKRSQLDDLSGLLLRNDNEAVEELLEKIARAEEAQTLLADGLRTLRATLAQACGCDAKDFNLSWLIERLPYEQAQALKRRRELVGDRVRAFRRQHMKTTILLTECSRITGMMLDTLAPSSSVTTYGSEGSDRWRAGAGLLDMER